MGSSTAIPPKGNNFGEPASSTCLSAAARIIAAYVACNHVPHADLPQLIVDTHTTLLKLFAVKAGSVVESELTLPKPAVPIKSSVTKDVIICLEDGKPFKSLRRHLKASYNLTPDEYRQKWGLPSDYPMTAPGYSIMRSRLAKTNGLGRKAKRKPS
ncbi:MucR family transcriptional regulator [Bosea sp. MMO-172]|uniref:MucR family transcriptional regulator n=1 Tax=Bosea sp. MMO-172 TaxID=3127885 RepID=UPI00301A5456